MVLVVRGRRRGGAELLISIYCVGIGCWYIGKGCFFAFSNSRKVGIRGKGSANWLELLLLCTRRKRRVSKYRVIQSVDAAAERLSARVPRIRQRELICFKINSRGVYIRCLSITGLIYVKVFE